MRRAIYSLWALAVVAILGVTYARPDWIVDPPIVLKSTVPAQCPPGSYLQGYDKETGDPVCNTGPTGCRYADHVPVGPECERLNPDRLASEKAMTQPKPMQINYQPMEGK